MCVQYLCATGTWRFVGWDWNNREVADNMSSKKQKVGSGDSSIERNQKACLTVLRALQKNPDAAPFTVPVDWKALKLPTYPKLIKVRIAA